MQNRLQGHRGDLGQSTRLPNFGILAAAVDYLTS
jgi:hypothetical protein